MQTQRLQPKRLYRRLDRLFGALDRTRPQGQVLTAFLREAFEVLRDDLHLHAALLYAERRDGFELLESVGDPTSHVAEMLAPGLGFLDLVFQNRVFIFPDPQAAASPQQGGALPQQPAAGLVVGRRPHRWLLFFVLAEGWDHEELDFALNTVRAALGARLIEERVSGSVREAAEIQQSLLLDEPPAFAGFEIACRSQPAEEVGGDFYDFVVLEEDILGLAIGDASGHGLPAALLVRDVVTGLRMGIEKELKVPAVFAKLNQVIHRSNLSSRFVSVFYGELEANGGLIYVNAGHPPPLLFGRRGIAQLSVGGTVIGPLPEVRFRRGFARIEPGGVLVLTTDGILERADRKGEFFGAGGVERVVREHRGEGAAAILEALFEAASEHGGARPFEDDATAVVVVAKPDAAVD